MCKNTKYIFPWHVRKHHFNLSRAKTLLRECLLTALSSKRFKSEMRKALRCCRFPRIIVKRWEQSAEWVSSCLKPLMMVLRDDSMDCCKLYDIFIPATAFICERKVLKEKCFRLNIPDNCWDSCCHGNVPIEKTKIHVAVFLQHYKSSFCIVKKEKLLWWSTGL